MDRAENRYCVITPYYKEEVWMLRRCIESVRRQTVPVDHILVADGFPQDWLTAERIRHITLDQPHRDYGDFARGVGALMAVAEKYDAITFLDADNWYDDDHVQCCLEVAKSCPGNAFVAAQRRFVRPDGSVMSGRVAEAPHADHIDTNCYFFLPRAYAFLHYWCTIPQELSPSGDHLFYLLLKANGIHPAIVPKPTINYLCMFEQVYRARGEEPPPGAKPSVDWRNQQAWIDALSPAELDLARALSGLALPQAAAS